MMAKRKMFINGFPISFATGGGGGKQTADLL